MLGDQAEYKLKIHKLMIQFNAGRMPDINFFNSFMPRVKEKVDSGRHLSDAEKTKIDELFDQY